MQILHGPENMFMTLFRPFKCAGTLFGSLSPPSCLNQWSFFPSSLPDMDELLTRWHALGNKKLPKRAGTLSEKPKAAGTKKLLTPLDEIEQTKKAIAIRRMREDDMRALNPTLPRNSSDGDKPEEGKDDDVVDTGIIDPDTICPYCDQSLPLQPTQKLLRMLKQAEATSQVDARPENVKGLSAPTLVMAPICSRHAFERDLVPKAQLHHWPTVLDHDDIVQRLNNKKLEFDALIEDTLYTQDGPRQRNVFWQAAIQNLSQPKLRGLIGTMADYHLYQPGYYGEQGTVIICEALQQLLTIPAESVAPLSPMQFISSVLILEAGVLLIMEDLGQGREEAISTMRESSNYGSQMFPYDDA
ncbi:hypothetical protein C8R43DRAFT_1021496 [Mycena crocata]|nr:hypothetical protein C8R43DRAFT_1021496 [Mycena crocata]